MRRQSSNPLNFSKLTGFFVKFRLYSNNPLSRAVSHLAMANITKKTGQKDATFYGCRVVGTDMF